MQAHRTCCQPECHRGRKCTCARRSSEAKRRKGRRDGADGVKMGQSTHRRTFPEWSNAREARHPCYRAHVNKSFGLRSPYLMLSASPRCATSPPLEGGRQRKGWGILSSIWNPVLNIVETTQHTATLLVHHYHYSVSTHNRNTRGLTDAI